MGDNVELEVCANCKREIPHYNYVMHTAHCARNITLCPTCKEGIPKAEFEQHAKACVKKQPKVKPIVIPTKIEQSSYFASRKEIEDKKIQQRKEKHLERLEKLVGAGNAIGHFDNATNSPTIQTSVSSPKHNSTSNLLPCQYCEIELPKSELGEHENYCGARTEKCQECGENVMFKYRELHIDTNHNFVRSPTQETPRRSVPLTSFVDYTPDYSYNPPGRSLLSTTSSTGEKLETSKEISRRLDCKTEYIRNLLHDSASITAPLRSTGAIPRHRQDKPQLRRNPPTVLVIPCEFCNTPIPHEDLIEHETGCRPDLVRYNPRREIDDMSFLLAPEPSSPDVELPCEFCADLIPASQLLSHQAACN